MTSLECIRENDKLDQQYEEYKKSQEERQRASCSKLGHYLNIIPFCLQFEHGNFMLQRLFVVSFLCYYKVGIINICIVHI